VLGSGDKYLAESLAALEADFPEQVALRLGYSEPLAHQIEAGADAFIMPSLYEPCGLNQMYSQRYGTPPVVRATGGLADTVVDCTAETLADGCASGFVFREASAPALLDAIERAARCWRDPASWRALQRNGMARDFGWEASARRYAALYAQLAPRR